MGPSHPQLEERFPRTRHLLEAYLFGDDSFEDEVTGYWRAMDPADVALAEAEIHELVTAVPDEEVTRFVEENSTWLVDDSGKKTLREVASILQELNDELRTVEGVMPSDDMVFFPGPPDPDAIDTEVARVASYLEGVGAVTRCWAQPPSRDEERLRVYGLVLDDGPRQERLRDHHVAAIRRSVEEPIGLEIMPRGDALPERQRRILDASVVLWERPYGVTTPG